MAVQKSILARTFTSKDGDYTITGATGALALGVPGNLYDASPYRAHTAVYPGADGEEMPLQYGMYYTGEGLAINPREHANFGVFSDDAAESGPLAASLYVRPGEVCTFVTFGHVVVTRVNAKGNHGCNILNYMNGRIIVDCPMRLAVSFGGAMGPETLAFVPDKIADWTASTDYAKGAFVANGGKVYCAKEDVAGATTFSADSWYEVDYNTTKYYWESSDNGAGKTFYYYDKDAVCVVEVDGIK